jgi:hypothetical protein
MLYLLIAACHDVYVMHIASLGRLAIARNGRMVAIILSGQFMLNMTD